MAFSPAFEPLPADYPNHLAAPRPERIAVRSRPWIPVLLALLCLTPRALMALRIPSICPDGVLYVRLAEAIEGGNIRAMFDEISLNIYPVILAILHRLGLGWVLAGTLWGVAMSSLVVLPLWGWARRQFDDRVALAACFLYIVHPKFIEWSPEVMRDQTFWLLFMLSIYWLWRAATEVRYLYYVLAGASITLASLTRIEGIYLLIPLSLWTYWRAMALETGRRRLLLGAVACVVVFPLLLVLVNAVLLFKHEGWVGIRLDPLERVATWIKAVIGESASEAVTESPRSPLTIGRMLWVFFPTMTRGLSPVFALLMFGGIWGWRRVWARRDNQALFLTALFVLGGIWVQLWYDRTICPRYALPIVLMGSVFAALGFLALLSRLTRWADRCSLGPGGRTVFAGAGAVLIATVCLFDAMTSNRDYFQTRRTAAEVGRWARTEFSSAPVLVGPIGVTQIVSFYGDTDRYVAYHCEASDRTILDMIVNNGADLVLLKPWKQLTPARCKSIAAEMVRRGFVAVDPNALPFCPGDIQLLRRAAKTPPVNPTAGRRFCPKIPCPKNSQS